MTNPNDARIVKAEVSFQPVPFRAPLKFGGRTVTQTDLINVTVEVEGRQGNRAIGHGSMPVGNVWAWPSTRVEPPEAQTAMKKLAEDTCAVATNLEEWGHPLDLMVILIEDYDAIAAHVMEEFSLHESIPVLAQLVANSSLDAAVHDAYGRLHGKSSYNVLSSEYMNHDLSHYLGKGFEGEYLDQYTSREPKATMPLYHLVGAVDPLTDADIPKRIDDGLPETLSEWILADGLTHLKIKLNGDDLEWDIDRVVAIDAIATEAQKKRGCTEWFYSLDFNEKCKDVEYVLNFLDGVRAKSPEAFDRAQYIEQPTHRDLHKHPGNKMHRAAAIKPVVIDESLVSLESLYAAEELGYTGVAFKACKGQTETLLLAAAAQKKGMFLCVQDLTCPGYSFLHSATLAARIPGIAAIEGNGRQYCPAPNAEWAEKYPGMFNVTDGTVKTAELNGVGLGF